ncbi:MAG TPA: hypothetical protein VKD71_14115 [Gemmataceae bacterium]|nr:hypothetical protein [Gemmataceae bacterium]
MRKFIIPVIAVLAGLAQPVLAAPLGKERAKDVTTLEQKIVGSWDGQTGCAGKFVFHADGTYELTGYGPAPYDSAGSWIVRWDALPPTLILNCKSSKIADQIGRTTELKLTQLDDGNLAVEHASQTVDRYARVKK